MSALHAALNAVQAIHPGRPTLQLGFPYVDVLKQPQVIFHGGELLQSTDLSEIADALRRLQPAAVIVELPSNPLLRCIDLPAVSRLARDQGVPIIADDTIGTAINLSVLEHVDLLFTSLTKSFAGRGDVMAGSLLISPLRHQHASLAVAVQQLAGLGDADAIALEAASRDVAVRVPGLDANCLALAERLEAHPAVASVMHPKSCTTFRDLMRPKAGFGCLLSFELNDGPLKTQRVYDALSRHGVQVLEPTSASSARTPFWPITTNWIGPNPVECQHTCYGSPSVSKTLTSFGSVSRKRSKPEEHNDTV